MSRAYIVGRGSGADIKIPKEHDAVGKLHLEIQETGNGQARITDLQSTNGTFVRAGRKWDEIKGPRIVPLEAELMLGDYKTSARKLLAAAPAVGTPPPLPVEGRSKLNRSAKVEPPATPAPKRTGPRRNEYGEIVND